MRICTAVLSSEYHEVSRHFKECPLYVRAKSQRRISAQFVAGIWPRLLMLVRASLACTTGAGGFSISPRLCFRLAVKESQAEPLIMEIIAYSATPPSVLDGGVAVTDSTVVEAMKHRQKKLQEMFQSGVVSPHEKLPDGSTLLHVSCFQKMMSRLLTCLEVVIRKCREMWPVVKGVLRDGVIDQVVELLRMLVVAGVPVDDVDMDQA